MRLGGRFACAEGGAPFLVLVADAVVCVVSLSGSLTGCVGDFGLGLRNGGDTLEGAAFFSVGFFSAAGVVAPFASWGLPAVF